MRSPKPKPMRAVVLESPGKLRLRDLPVPEPAPDQVLLEVKAAGVCGTDLHIYEGDFPATFPLIPGHEFSGQVVAAGGDVGQALLGARVAVDPNVPCRSCTFCSTRREHLCKRLTAYGVHRNGGFAEHAVVNVQNVHPIGDLSFEQGALIEPLACVLHGMSLVQIRLGDEVLIFGAGPIGLLLCQAALHGGAARLAVVDLSEEKLESARSVGADEVHVGKRDPRPRIRKTHPDGFDLVIDATGVPAVVESLPAYVRDGGKLLYFGVCPQDARISLSPFEVYRRELKIFGTFSLLGDFVPAIRLVESGRVDLAPIVSHRFPLKEFDRAIKLMGTQKHRKIIISRT